jgi:hypothetical protein
VYRFTRYLKDNDNGAAEDLGASIPLSYPNLPSGNYVVQIDFFRFKFVRVSRLIQTIIVRDGLTTNRWGNGGSTLTWGTDKFASSNANLGVNGGIKIGSSVIDGYDPTRYAYNISERTSLIPSDKTLTVKAGAPGQAITVSLSGATEVRLTSGTAFTLTPMKAANSIAITVTAPDGVTKRTYAVSYTYYNATEWYVKASGSGGSDLNSGESDTNALATVTVGALLRISTAYNNTNPSWPGKSGGNPVAARINIIGTITETVTISGSTLYPPIILTGTNSAQIQPSLSRPLAIDLGATVILEGDLTLNGGSSVIEGGGVRVSTGGIFTMNGGTISGNAASNGGGVYVSGSFTMNSGTISGNGSTSSNGGGVYVAGFGSRFTMNGGAISGNTAGNGGGVYVVGSGSSFTMNGGTIGGSVPADKNTATNDGGGVYVTGDGNTFTMNGGTISGNTAGQGGGGVLVSDSGRFIMKGGSVRGNSAAHGGGVIIFKSSNYGVTIGGKFEMEGGSISENTATGTQDHDNGGGVVLFNAGNVFTMSGGTISGNSVARAGGGVALYPGANNSFTMSGGTISGNTAGGNGGGVYFYDGDFNMEDNALIDQDNDVWIADNKAINIQAALTAAPYAARITPQSYPPPSQVLIGGAIDPYYTRFTVTSNGYNWTIDSGGLLVLQP